MGGMDEMMEAMIGSMSKEDKQVMMAKMMEKFFAGMTAEDKQRMMEQMMPKMMEGINMAEMMPRMMMGMMGMMGHGGRPGPRTPRAPHATGEHHPHGPAMMGNMMSQMMPGCVDMMLPGMPKEDRTEFVLDMISRLMEKGTAGMSEEEKSSLVARALERITSL